MEKAPARVNAAPPSAIDARILVYDSRQSNFWMRFLNSLELSPPVGRRQPAGQRSYSASSFLVPSAPQMVPAEAAQKL